MRNVLKFIVYLLCIINLPLTIISVIVIWYKQVKVSAKLNLSSTMVEVINGRYTMHIFKLKNDLYCKKLMWNLKTTSPTSFILIFWPFLIYTLFTGEYLFYPRKPTPHHEIKMDLIPGRTVYFDTIINKHKGNCSQFVVLGAGLDTRCYNDFNDITMDLFEADQKTIQDYKKNCLRKAKIDSSRVNFAALDFNTDNWFKSLQAVGFDKNKKTIVLWEGVTLYLPEESVNKTLQILKDNLASGSIITMDFYDKDFIQMGTDKKTIAGKMLNETGELFKSGLDLKSKNVDAIKEVIEPIGLEYDESFIMGDKTKSGAFMAVCSALVK